MYRARRAVVPSADVMIAHDRNAMRADLQDLDIMPMRLGVVFAHHDMVAMSVLMGDPMGHFCRELVDIRLVEGLAVPMCRSGRHRHRVGPRRCSRARDFRTHPACGQSGSGSSGQSQGDPGSENS